jgi:hypothetical protein
VTSVLQFDHGMVGARILWRHWVKDASDVRREGCVQAFSPSGENVRMSEGPIPAGGGDWMETKTVRVIEVLELCYVQRIEEEIKKREAAEAAKRAAKRKKKKQNEDAEEGDES